MNSESNLKIQRTQSNRSTSYKRAHRAKRPVLVTETPSTESNTLVVEEEQAPAEAALEEQSIHAEETGRKRGPRFFSSVEKAEKATNQPKADPMAARLARALRGKGADTPKDKEPAKEKKSATSSNKPAATTPARPKSNFKMKYIWGMMIYLLIADFLGGWIQVWMQSQHLDALLFTLGPIPVSRSTLIFLALLVIILIVMARLDLIPRSLGAAMTNSSSQRKDAPRSDAKTPTFESREAQPTLKQGVKGTNDDLYREYRENQRYFQKRDRKR